ncbi:MAG: YihY/virulence factor BrkB family protein, partial [Planctomycetota bacterium]
MFNSHKLREKLLTLEERLASMPKKFLDTLRILVYAIREFRRDIGLERAATLSFATILSLIPLTVLFFGFAGMLGGGDRIIKYVEEQVFKFVAPEFQEQISEWLANNISKEAFSSGPAGVVNTTAIAALLVAALGLLTAAERIFNVIWKIKGNRGYLKRLSAFWLILTTSPFLIAASISIGAVLVPKDGVFEGLLADYWIIRQIYEFGVPFVTALLGFSTVYLFLPATRVRLRSALAGGFTGALLWSLSKVGFILYVSKATTAATFYGQLATVPLLLVWIYLSWAITIFGAEISYVHQNLATIRKASRAPDRQRSKLLIGFEILTRIDAALSNGIPAQTSREMATDMATQHENVEEVCEYLVSKGILVEDALCPGRFVLGRSADSLRLSEVAEILIEAEFKGELTKEKGADTPAEITSARAWS